MRRMSPKPIRRAIIARIENRSIARGLEGMRVPVVDLSAAGLLPRAPVVTTDNAAIARLAVQHFIERGFRNFARVQLGRVKELLAGTDLALAEIAGRAGFRLGRVDEFAFLSAALPAHEIRHFYQEGRPAAETPSNLLR